MSSSDQTTLSSPTPKLPIPTAGATKGPGLRLLAFGLVVLGLCVFAWGLKYKLSLYDPPHAISHHMPAARLLSGRDKSQHAVVDFRSAVNLPASLAIYTLTLVFFVLTGSEFCAGPGRWSPHLLSAPAAAQLGRHSPFFVRPPPFVR